MWQFFYQHDRYFRALVVRSAQNPFEVVRLAVTQELINHEDSQDENNSVEELELE